MLKQLREIWSDFKLIKQFRETRSCRTEDGQIILPTAGALRLPIGKRKSCIGSIPSKQTVTLMYDREGQQIQENNLRENDLVTVATIQFTTQKGATTLMNKIEEVAGGLPWDISDE